MNPLTEVNSRQKFFFQIMLNEVLKICEKMISDDVKANIKQHEIKDLLAVSYKFL